MAEQTVVFPEFRFICNLGCFTDNCSLFNSNSGCGFVGSALAQFLCNDGNYAGKIILYDVKSPIQTLEESSNAIFLKGDITSGHDLLSAFKGHQVEAVIHAAGFGLAGTTNLPAFNDVTKKVNVDGTQRVIEACLLNNVKALVFTSTVNVVFKGKEIINGNESTHQWLQNGHLDFYSRTKQMAEKMVINANGAICKDGITVLRTCVLRMGGVYGPYEKTILERSLYLMSSKLGYLSFCHRKDLKIDFLHIDNAVQGHVKATEKLLQNCERTSGQIFYITDDNPSSLFYFLDPLHSILKPGSEHCPPAFHIPPLLTKSASMVFHSLSVVFGKKYKLPFWGFTLMESYKINVNHFFSIAKAQEVLGYEPRAITRADWQIILASLQK